MSASREKKARQERGADYVSPKEQKAREEAKAARRTTTVFAVCAALFVVAVAAMLLNNSGVFQRGAAAASVNGKTYTAGDMAYYYYNGLANLSRTGSVDSSTSLREQEYTVSDDYDTWYDYLSDRALQSLADAELTAQAAKDAGFDGGSEVQDTMNETLDSLKSTASGYGYSVGNYLKAIFGSLMTRSVFERNLRTVTLADAYVSSLSDPASYTEAELSAARNADPDAYDAISVRHILVSDEDTAKDILAQWEGGDRTEDSFAALAQEHSADNADDGGLYTDVLQGTMVAPFNDWCFDSSRKTGDTGIVETMFGYHVMYFVDRYVYSDWQALAASNLASEKLAPITDGANAELLGGMKYIDP